MATLQDLNVIITANTAGFEANMANVANILGSVGNLAKTAGSNLSQYVTAPLLLLGGAAVKAFGDLQALETGFKAVYKGAADVNTELARTKEVAKLPGLGLTEAVQGSVRLQAVGISAEQARKSLLAFGNAIATTGGGAAQLGQVTVQLAQLAAKGKVLTQDLRPIIEAAPAVAEALQKLYGTIDAQTISEKLAKDGKNSKDFIAAITTELAKLPSVSGGVRNAIENASDSIFKSLAKVGEVLNKTFDIEGKVTRFGDFVEGLADNFATLSPAAQGAILTLVGLAVATGPVLLAVGTLGAAIPVLTVGFTALGGAITLATGPVGIAVVAIAGLAAGIYYLVNANERALESFQAQDKATTALQTSVEPLLSRYEELQAKTKRTREEQSELESVIKQVAEAMPGAVSKVDAYGNVLDINAVKTRGLIKVEEQLSRLRAQQAIGGATKDLEKRRQELALLEREQKRFNETGQIFTVFGSQAKFSRDLGDIEALFSRLKEVRTEYDKQEAAVQRLNSVLSASGKAFRDVQRDAAALQVTLTKPFAFSGDIGGELDAFARKAGIAASASTTNAAAAKVHAKTLGELKTELKDAREALEGMVGGTQEFNTQKALIARLDAQIKKLEDTGKAARKAASDISKAFADIRKGLGSVDTQVNLGLVGAGAEATTEKIKILDTGLKRLADLGVTSASKALQALNTQYLTLRQSLNQGIEPLDVKATEVKLNTPKLPKQLPSTLVDEANALANANLSIAAGMREVNSASLLFGAGFDTAAGKANVLANELQNLLSNGVSPLNPAVQALGQQLQTLSEQQALISTFRAGVANSFAGIGDSIGEAFGAIVTGSASLSQGLDFVFGSIISSIGDFMGIFGQQLIALGVAKLGLDNLFKAGVGGGVAAIAAGVGLIALSGIAKSVGKNAAGNLGRITGAGGGGGYSGPNQQAAGQKRDTLKIEVVFAPFELRADGTALRAVMQVDSYRFSQR